MVEKKNETLKPETPKNDPSKTPHLSYTINEVFKITDDLFTLSKEREYPLGAFVHGLIFALEFAQQSYKIPPQQLAEIKRDCRRYVDEIVRTNTQKTTTEQKKK
ncbi:MAG TPA: hypothetical protein VMY59_03010 [Candidatus Thermoplasmatota archaeon]|nr:hypothetical protein [Candidatus Thermoplasmatota archaeon]